MHVLTVVSYDNKFKLVSKYVKTEAAKFLRFNTLESPYSILHLDNASAENTLFYILYIYIFTVFYIWALCTCRRLVAFIARHLVENAEENFAFREDIGFHVKLVFSKTEALQPDQRLCMAFRCWTGDMLRKTSLCNTMSLSLWSQVFLARSAEADFCSCWRVYSLLFCFCDQMTTLPWANGKWKTTEPFFGAISPSCLLLSFASFTSLHITDTVNKKLVM